jgi:hypothetical protein
MIGEWGMRIADLKARSQESEFKRITTTTVIPAKAGIQLSPDSRRSLSRT